MVIGHAAVGLGLKAADRRLNVGLLIFAAFFSDFVFGWFVLAGWESYYFPLDFEFRHYMLFTFPWSHGLVSDLVFGSCLGMLVWSFRGQVRAGILIAIAVVSHFLLDGLVHVQGLPVMGPESWKLGLGLWNHLPLELTLEGVMTIVGLWLYLRATPDHTRARRIAMVIYISALGALAIVAQATISQPLERPVLVAAWIAGPVVFALIAGVLDRQPAVAEPAPQP